MVELPYCSTHMPELEDIISRQSNSPPIVIAALTLRVGRLSLRQATEREQQYAFPTNKTAQ